MAIDPATVEVGVGLGRQLTARGRFSNGSTEVVPVRWSITPNSIATISTGGEVFGIRLGIATVSAAHDSGLVTAAEVRVVGNPAFTFPPQDNMTGLWTGEYVLDVCSKVSGSGPSICRFSLESRLPIRLELTQNGTALNGQLTIYSDVSGSVTGWRDSSGFHVLFGTLTGQDGAATLSAQLSKWEVKATTPLNEMTGTFETVERLTTPGDLQVYRRGGTFINVKRQQ